MTGITGEAREVQDRKPGSEAGVERFAGAELPHEVGTWERNGQTGSAFLDTARQAANDRIQMGRVAA